MVNNANKTRSDVSNTYQTNRMQGVDKERELEILSVQAEQFVGTHGAMVTNGTADMDNRIQQLRAQVSSNVNQVLEGQKAESLQVQTQQIETSDTAAQDQGSALHNKTQQSKLSQAVVEVIGQHEHEAIRDEFQEEADYHEGIKQDSTQDQRNLDNTTRQTDQVVNATLQRLNNIL